jgi:ABC-2 type transport system ATP-binding protein
MPAEPLFRIKNISKYFGNKKVLSNISFDIMPGEILGIIGASGTGKTTLLNILVGFLRADKGSLLFRFEHLLSFKNTQVYREVSEKTIEIKKMVGFAAQKPSFYPNLTVQENMEYFGSLFNLSRDALLSNIEALLNLMELKPNRFLLAKNLSGGMQRRLDIACSLVHDPKILILDEPTSDLDPILRKHVWELIKIIRSKGTTIILSSHHLTEIEHLCDRLAVLKGGTFVEINTFDYIKKKYIKHKKVNIEIKSKNYDRLLKRVPIKLVKNQIVQDNELIITTKNPTKLISTLIRRAESLKDEIINLAVANPNLDEIFVSISKDEDEKAIIKDDLDYDALATEEISKMSDLSRKNRKKNRREPKKNKKTKKIKKDKKTNNLAKRESVFIYK